MITFWKSFLVFTGVNLFAAFYAPIQDCDEVYNYWEPTHYLTHGYGLQTWEYAPQFALRSWLYIVLHAIPGKILSFVVPGKHAVFYLVRAGLGLSCAACEARLFTTLQKVLNPRIGVMFMIVMVSSPGMFHASTAYLPSSFAMYTGMLGMAAFVDWKGGSQAQAGLGWFGLGSILGWPFAFALVGPFLVEELVVAWITHEGVDMFTRVLDGTLRCVLIVVSLSQSVGRVDSLLIRSPDCSTGR